MHENPRDGRRDLRRHLKPGDLPKPRNREEAVAQRELCQSQIEGIEQSIRTKTEDRFPTKYDFDQWRESARFAQSQWEMRLKIVELAVVELDTLESQIRTVCEENKRLREMLNTQQRKAQRRRTNQALERCLMRSVLTGDAPVMQKEAAIEGLSVRMSDKFYAEWLRRARANNWIRRGPLGRFDKSSSAEEFDDEDA
jgi:hypothetical protein